MKKLFSAIASASFLLSASGCATYVENQASLAFEPIYPHANLAADEGVPTGGIYRLVQTAYSPVTSAHAMLVIS